MNTINFRPARTGDANAIAEMLSQLAEELGDGDIFCSTSETILRYGFGEPQMFNVVVAELRNEVCGFALCFPYFSTTKGKPGVYVQDLWIAQSMRDGGAGQKLLMAVAADAASRWGAAFLKLTVHASNSKAARFYKRLGLTTPTNEVSMIAEPKVFSELLEAA